MMAHHYLALTGGIGGAKLALGLSNILGEDELAFVVNTGDDFEHLGLHISPDIDTLVYTLAGENNPDTGWGRRDETWQFMSALDALGGETWFKLGDKDLAMNVERSVRLMQGASLGQVTADLAQSLGVRHKVLPMSNDPVRTQVHTEKGNMDFQQYFVREACEPLVKGFKYQGAATARINPEFLDLLEATQLAGIVLCPSNPFISIDPILSLQGLRKLLQGSRAPVIAVSPVVDGNSLKGPLAKMMHELSVPTTASSIATHYRDILDGLILDLTDESLVSEIESMGIATLVTNTVMKSLEDRVKLAQNCLEFTTSLSESSRAKSVSGG